MARTRAPRSRPRPRRQPAPPRAPSRAISAAARRFPHEGYIPRFPRVEKIQQTEFWEPRAVNGMVVFLAQINGPPQFEIWNGVDLAWEQWDPGDVIPNQP